ncbi:MAG TPA: DUF4175 family protein, partial [Bacteroidota bacterium]|nr:DUF4175 family protein [Bacteroidota bacterium]
MVFAIVTLLAIAVGALLELGVGFDRTGRTILFSLFGLLELSIFTWFVARPSLRSMGVLRSNDEFTLASAIGRHFPAVHDRLLNILQIHRELSTGGSLYSPELIDASFEDLADAIRGVDFADAVDGSAIGRLLKLLALSFAGIALLVLASPRQFTDALGRIVHFNREYAPPAEFIFEISPGNTEVPKGQRVDIAVNVRAASPAVSRNAQSLDLAWRLEGTQSFESARLRPDSLGVFRTVFQNLRGTTEYFASVSGTESPHYRLLVVDRPVFRSFQVRLDYPAYTRIPPKVQEEFVGDVSALAGTKITLTGLASKDLKEGAVRFAAGASVPLTVHDQRFSASFRLDTETSYHIEVSDFENLQNVDPVRYQLKIVPDDAPSIAITQPGHNIDLAGDKFLRLQMQAKDDFGISSIRIGYKLTHSRYEQPWDAYRYVTVPLPAGAFSELELPYTWDLSPLRLEPEDVVEYFAEVFDNDAVHGPKSGKSQVYQLRLPSVEEVFAELDKNHETSLDDLKQTLQDAKQLKDKIESISQDIKKNKQTDWQQQKKMEEMSKKYQDVQKRLDEVQKRLDEMVQKMDQQQVLSKETMDKYTELQQMFEQMNSAELQQALKQLQQGMQNLNKDQIQQAMQKLTFSEERFRQSIERTIELLKRIQVEQKLDEARKRAQELEKSQSDLNQQTKSSPNDQQSRKDLARKQKDLAEKQQELQDVNNDVQKRMEEFFTEMPADRMQKLNEQAKQQNTKGAMEMAGQQLEAGQDQQAQQTQQEVSQQLQQQSKQLQSIQQEMIQKQTQATLNALRRASNDMLELSKREESLKQGSAGAPMNSPQLRDNAEDQMGVMQDMGNVVRGLSELSKKSFAVTPEMGKSIGEAIGHMQGSLNALEGRNGFGASQEEGAAMASLNKTAQQIQNAMQNMMNQSGSGMGGLMQQLQMMAGQQQTINSETQSMQQAAEAARLAVEQEAVRKSLEQLNKEAQASGEQKKMLGDLDKVAEDMKEVVQNLEQNNVNRETIQKQERILSRLLDASKSMRERDYEKKRKAQTGTEIARRSPGDLDPSALEGTNKLLDDLLKSLEHGYSKD